MVTVAGIYATADDLMIEEPKKQPTRRGLAMLKEVWIAQGRPAKPYPVEEYDDPTQALPVAPISKLESFRKNARSAGAVRSRLTNGGYLHCYLLQGDNDLTIFPPRGDIIEMQLSVRGFDALIEAGFIQE